MNHFDEMTCLLYLEGELPESRASDLKAHAAGCSECRAILRALEEESLLLSASLREADEAIPAGLLPRRHTGTAHWAWLLGFALAGMAAYMVWTGLIVPLQESMSQTGMGVGSLLTMLFFSGTLWKGWSSMFDMLQVAALVTLGVGALALLRGRLRRRTTFAAVFVALGLLAVLPQPAAAAELHKGETYVLPQDQEVHDDLIVTGESVRIDGTVDGDVIAFARSVTVNGHVAGDVIGFAQFLSVGGTVDGNIRGFVNTLTLDGSVGKNVSAAAQTLEINSDGKVGGSLMSFAEQLLLEGKVGGSLMAFGQRIDLDGTVGGSEMIRGQHLAIASSAQLNGPIRFVGEEEPEVEQGARLASPVQFEKVAAHDEHKGIGRSVVGEVLRYGAALLVGLLLMSLLPGLYSEAVLEAKRFGAAIGVGSVGLLAFILLMILGIGLMIVGTAAGFALALGFVPMMYLAQIFVAAWLGDAILGERSGLGEQFSRLALGLVILDAIELVPILGGLVGTVITVWGAGALLLALYKKSRATPAAAPVPA